MLFIYSIYLICGLISVSDIVYTSLTILVLNLFGRLEEVEIRTRMKCQDGYYRIYTSNNRELKLSHIANFDNKDTILYLNDKIFLNTDAVSVDNILYKVPLVFLISFVISLNINNESIVMYKDILTSSFIISYIITTIAFIFYILKGSNDIKYRLQYLTVICSISFTICLFINLIKGFI